ncbi:MAG: hypothetical protein E2O56_00310 [Gammaproteobacteria bacterium]|nr:MAG: hypothetical protein E2O56_00310 [Gammaproteobacteria bacterium]
MSYRQVDVSSGWDWYVQGWSLFMKNPGMWLVTALVMMIVLAVLSWFPVIGPPAAALINPALLGGMMYGAQQLARGASFEFPHLFQAFRDSDRTGPMILLGLLPMAMLLIMVVFFGAAIFSMLMGALLASKTAGISGAFSVASVLFGLLLLIPIGILLYAALFFAIPRVMLDGVNWIEAIKSSLSACLANVVPMILFLVILMVASVLAAVLTSGLGMFLIAPVLIAAMYCAYTEVYSGGKQSAD